MDNVLEKIDVNFDNHLQHPQHNRHQVLQKYATAMRQLRRLAEQSYGVNPFYFDNYILFQYFQQREDESQVHQHRPEAASITRLRYMPSWSFLKLELLRHILDRRRKILFSCFYLSLVLLSVLFYRHMTTTTVGVDQPNIPYPAGMRLWRRMTLPLIQRFPRLTELYDETCLMANPFFQIEDLSCEPCAHVQSVQELMQNKGGSLLSSGSSRVREMVQRPTAVTNEERNEEFNKETAPPSVLVPYIFKINQSAVQLEDIYKVYTSNQDVFQRDAFRVHSTNRDINNLEQLFNHFNSTQLHNYVPPSLPQSHTLWRCNRMLPARLLRKLFARPTRLPSTGLALERFVLVDTPQAPAYTLPETECANTYIQQALGARFLILRPTSECRTKCRTLSIRLPESFVVTYNFWYWKPISAPDPASETLSISLIGSYC